MVALARDVAFIFRVAVFSAPPINADLVGALCAERLLPGEGEREGGGMGNLLV